MKEIQVIKVRHLSDGKSPLKKRKYIRVKEKGAFIREVKSNTIRNRKGIKSSSNGHLFQRKRDTFHT